MLNIITEKKLIVYETELGFQPLYEFLSGITSEYKERILSRLERIEHGNLGDYKNVSDGVYELRFDFGSGYRLFGKDGDKIIILLCGGDKSSQKKDIKKAKEYWQKYNLLKEEEHDKLSRFQ